MPPLKTKDVNVTVHLDLNHEPDFYFETSLPMKNHDNLVFSRGNQDGFKISFTLDDPDHLYTFGKDKDEALYSTAQAVCPTEKGQWDEFKALNIENGDLTLVVHNKNKSTTDFGYTLRITKDAGKTYKDLDPIGTNQNSNIKASFLTVAAIAVGGAVIGGLASQVAMPAATQTTMILSALVGGAVALGIYLVVRGGMEKIG